MREWAREPRQGARMGERSPKKRGKGESESELERKGLSPAAEER